MDRVFQLGERITILPIIHGSGDCALEVRRRILARRFDCLAVPLPPSFQHDVEQAIDWLPTPTVVTQRAERRWDTPASITSESSESELDADADSLAELSYVPIDPCQPVIAALRIAREERMRREFIDLETERFEAYSLTLPDPYALKRTSLERFAAAVLPTLPPVPAGQPRLRLAHMARRLRDLERRHDSVLMVCSLADWPWLVDAYLDNREEQAEAADPSSTEWFNLEPSSLLFLLGELPFITGLYERARAELDDDEHLSIDGIKELFITARDAYRKELRDRARKITPLVLSQILKYARNLTLMDRRLTPDLYTLVSAAKQVVGDAFAVQVAETAREYPATTAPPQPRIRMGIGQGRLADGELVNMVSRLPGPPLVWRSLSLQPRPQEIDKKRWQMRWNPFSQCSWPPEDQQIENFRAHLFDRAKQTMGADLVKTEKFTTSIKDGIDIRDTVRHWYDGEIYVKILPPNRGRLDCAVMLFDAPADPRRYAWRTTWFAEHADESTLAFFATNFREEIVGPGICQATYGGVLFLYPPIAIPDIWHDPRLDFCETLEERLLGAACLHSRCPQIVLLSPLVPGAGWRRLAKRFKKTFVHLPLSHFSESTIQQLRRVHVLNGTEVRSYAANFIRRP